jgi:hypothetical protein
MKVQLSDKEYVSNFEGHWFESMLSHFFLSIIYARWGGGQTRRSVGVIGSTSKI